MNKNSVVLLNALPDKKIKSLGNKCLINITKNINILDYHIRIINSIFKKPEIIVVGGFESKKLKKYIDSTYKDIRYIDHSIDNNTNIGTSIYAGVKLLNSNNCFILNTTFILNKNIISLIKKYLDSSFVITSSNNLGTGCIIDSNRITHCYYDLPSNFPLDAMYIHKNDINTFNQICDDNIKKLFFFELINLCINNNISLKPLDIPKKSFLLIDSMSSIQKIKSKSYV